MIFHCDITQPATHAWHLGLMLAVPFAWILPLHRWKRRSAPFESDETRNARYLTAFGIRAPRA